MGRRVRNLGGHENEMVYLSFKSGHAYLCVVVFCSVDLGR